MTVERFSFSTTPGDALRTFFSSQAAAIKGSQNIAGIADPVIDALIDKIIAADDARRDSIVGLRALDRVFRAGRYWVPQWYKPSHCARLLGHVRPSRDKTALRRGIPETWWYDRDKAAKLERAG